MSRCELSLKEIAPLVRKEIRGKFPEFKVSVRTYYFAGGQALRIKVTEVPPNFTIKVKAIDIHGIIYTRYTKQAAYVLDEMKKITDKYNWDNSESMTDCFDVHFYCAPHYELRLEK